MLTAVLGVVAALAFVLGLGALCLWGLKRWGNMSLTARPRIAVEVVQRVSLGPKAGLAVVRVGEKVMAVSVGDGGIRTLFELDESDRQRVIESSMVPTPMTSSVEASAAFAKFAPSAFGKTMASMLTPAAASAPTMVQTPTPHAEPVVAVSAVRAQRAAITPEIPSFLTASSLPSSLFSGSLSNATRLAVLVGAMVLSSAGGRALHAQVATPPAPTPTVGTPRPVVGTPNATPTQTPTALPPAPKPPQAPLLPPSMRTGRGRVTSPATPAATATTSATPRQGNGASTNADGTASRRPASQMQVDSAPVPPNGRATAAQPAAVGADEGVMKLMPQMDVQFGDGKDGGLRLNGTVGIVVMMGLLTMLPTLLLMMTGFTRILIVLHFLKQAMGTQSAPPAQLLAAMALLLTGFVMAPTLSEVNNKAITPWLDGQITQVEMLKTGVVPMREFMLRQTREADLKTFVEMSRLPRPNSAADVPLHVLMSAFVASELRTAFQIGFAIYLPFIIIDAVVASVLMSMGMFMLPPAMISLPFKLLLFVLVDGWSLTISSLVQSFK
ncbi:MAG: flagellar type III secretion system pore protein FliP [Gemmatimonadaceae bacterium]|nr:flagellar type III secretion system pore protein FliP [Gemmatimonadaceae bacterium]